LRAHDASSLAVPFAPSVPAVGGRWELSPAGVCSSFGSLSTAVWCHSFSVIFTFVALVLFIVSLATPAMFEVSNVDDTFSAKVGPFRTCWRLDLGPLGSKNGCGDVNGHCAFTTDDDKDKTTQKVVDDCDKFNAARGFQVMGGIFTAAALLVQLVVVCAKPGSGALRGASALLGVLAGACGLISMALWANMEHNDKAIADNQSSSLGYSFWLLVAGWVLAFAAALPFCTKK